MDDVVVCDDKMVGGGMGEFTHSVQTVMNRVFDGTNNRIKVGVSASVAEAHDAALQEQDIWNRVFDADNNVVRMDG